MSKEMKKQFCNYCGSEMMRKDFYSFNPKTGKQYIYHTQWDCPKDKWWNILGGHRRGTDWGML